MISEQDIEDAAGKIFDGAVDAEVGKHLVRLKIKHKRQVSFQALAEFAEVTNCEPDAMGYSWWRATITLFRFRT